MAAAGAGWDDPRCMRRLSLALALPLALASLGCAKGFAIPDGEPRAPPPSAPTVAPSASAPPSDPRVAAAIAFAEAQLGKRYCWGGTGPTCFDCSGLVQASWRWGGVRLPRTTGAQARALVEVSPSELQPGDILWWSHGHVGLYVGGGQIIDAYHSRAGVVRRPAPKAERVLRVVPAPVTVAQTP